MHLVHLELKTPVNLAEMDLGVCDVRGWAESTAQNIWDGLNNCNRNREHLRGLPIYINIFICVCVLSLHVYNT